MINFEHLLRKVSDYFVKVLGLFSRKNSWVSMEDFTIFFPKNFLNISLKSHTISIKNQKLIIH